MGRAAARMAAALAPVRLGMLSSFGHATQIESSPFPRSTVMAQ